ncbi:MAG: TSUP family transporter [Deltaproteobacteria bacterium]|nr:TSUP family transporter [Deltaproteobacteria bacterium]
MILALALAALMGVALGMLGGGGSILTVPILLYVIGLPAKQAIATSLLVVGVTSAFAVIAHARAGRVLWRTAALFGGAGMAGAFLGGRLAHFIPSTLLLLGFAAMMLATAIAMLRPPRDAAASGGDAGDGEVTAPPRQVARILVDGLVVGLVTGLIGAGGGFLVVPALVLLGRLPFKTAVGTSLVVIAMKSFAGFAGYLGHVSIDWSLAATVSAVAVVGTLLGGLLTSKVPQRTLRQVFAWFVVVMAVYLVGRQLPASVRDAQLFQDIFVARWPWWIGGSALAGFVLFFLWYDNKLLGVSTGCAELTALRREPALRRSWRLPFLGGIVLGGAIAALLAGSPPRLAVGGIAMLASLPALAKLGLLAGAGVLMGYGARAAGGCTSGHSIVGSALGGRASLLSTAAFLVAGFATTQLLVALV